MNPFGEAPHEPPVRSDALRELIELARHQPTPPVKVELEAIQRALGERRTRTRQGFVGLAAAAAVVVAVAGLWGQRPDSAAVPRSDDAPSRGAAPTIAAVEDTRESEVKAPVERAVGPSNQTRDPGPSQLASATDVAKAEEALASGVRVQSLVETDAPQVLGRWEVSVAAGRYMIDVPPTAEQALLVRVGERVLEVEPGARVALDVDERSRFELRHGKARWQSKRGRDPLSAEALARLADTKMAAGDRQGARSVLEKLVRGYPRHAVTRAALLDLARLLRAEGRTERARCAYLLYRSRYGDSALRGELTRALDELGPSSQQWTCRGLKPLRRPRRR